LKSGKIVLRIGVFVATLQALVLARSYAEDPAALAERMRETTKLTSLDVANLQPWYLKMEVQTFDDKGQLSEQSTVEEWWAGPMLNREVYTSPRHTTTEIHNADGYYRTAGEGPGAYQLDLMRQQVVHPLPSQDEIDSGELEERTEDLGKVKLDCLMLGQQIRGVAFFPFGLFPMYCMDHGNNSLRLSYDFANLVIARNSMGSFLGKSVPLEIDVNVGGKTILSAKVVTLKTVPLTSMDFVPGTGLEKLENEPAKVVGAVIGGNLLKETKVQPVYPESARERGVSGTVVMRAIIGSDGHIRRLKLLSYPDADLAISALQAVRYWTYKPYTLNGEPTSVDTTITVNYAIGRR
jgi:TonB family protein